MVTSFGIQDPEAQSKAGGQEDSKKWRDWWAALLYVIHVIAVGALAVWFGVGAVNDSDDRDASLYNIKHWAPQLAVVIIFAAIFSFLWISLVKYFPVGMIKFALWAGVVANLVLAILVLASRTQNSVVVGIIFFVFAVIQALYAYWVRFRVPFAAALITKAIMVTGQYPACYIVSYAAVIVSVFWIGLWSFGASGAIATMPHAAAIVFGLLVSLYWTMEVIRNVVHVTVAGTVGTFYFQQQNMPRNPTIHALRRATSTSLGSICFGSLIVSILEAIRVMVRGLQGQCNEFVVCCLSCLLGVIESLMQYFNKWAYIQVALYGKTFVKASKDTWTMFKAQGLDVLINDDLTSTVLFIGCIIGGVLSGILGGLWTYFHVTTSDDRMTVSVVVLSFFIGYFITHLTMAVVNSGVACYYVCFAEDPATLRRNDPEFYEVMWTRQALLRG
ncbi:hypothetical protein R1sor_018508 [Riccia sorocarpa]|uniref:Choline transporter-like protein n=1 Tax=Riccia sorocarpa TaxID=122646 RepID=A0ABD3IAX8_9MARC